MEDGTQALKEITDAFQAAKMWDPIIRLSSSHIVDNDRGTYDVTVPSSNTEDGVCLVDIISVLRMSRHDIEDLQSNLQRLHKYPPNTIYRFEGMEGLEEKDNVRKILFQAGKENGTDLVSRSGRVAKHSLT